jgi:hypothetical protein
MTQTPTAAIYQIGCDTVSLISADLAHVTSKSHPGMSYSVTTGGRCSCIGYYHRNHCRHIDAMREARRQQAETPISDEALVWGGNDYGWVALADANRRARR